MSDIKDDPNIRLEDVLIYAFENLSDDDRLFFLLEARKEILKKAATSLSEPRISFHYLKLITIVYDLLHERMKTKDE